MGANTARSVSGLACVDEQGWGRVYAVLRLFYARGLPLIGSLSMGGAFRPPPNSMSALWAKSQAAATVGYAVELARSLPSVLLEIKTSLSD
jgi:hypothetical protein